MPANRLAPSDAFVGFDYAEAFSRNIGLVSPVEQQRLRETGVAVAGLGGVGGLHVQALARLGIGRFALADLDRFELANINRQAGATLHSLGRPKVDVMAEAVAAINPTAELSLFPSGIDASNIDAFLDGATVAVDGIDFFNMEARRLLFRAARARGIHAVTAAPAGFGATLQVFAPEGMSFDDYFDLRDGMRLPEQLLRFVLGLAPKRAHRSYFPPDAVDFARRRAPSISAGCYLCAAVVSAEIVNLVLRRRPVRAAPYYFQFDPLAQRYETGWLWRGNRHPLQRAKRWWLLLSQPRLRALLRHGHAPDR